MAVKSSIKNPESSIKNPASSMKITLLFLSGVGFQEVLLIGMFVLVFFGANKIPEFMKGLGKGVREFKGALNDIKEEGKSITDETKE